jgi:hypothetical protein
MAAINGRGFDGVLTEQFREDITLPAGARETAVDLVYPLLIFFLSPRHHMPKETNTGRAMNPHLSQETILSHHNIANKVIIYIKHIQVFQLPRGQEHEKNRAS